MKKALRLTLLSVLVGCSDPHDPTGGGKLTMTKHENGKTASRGYVIADAVTTRHIKVGDWVYFFKDGKKEKEGRCFEDQRHGTWTFWLPDGSESWIAEYKNGAGSKNGKFMLTSGELRDRDIRAARSEVAFEETIEDTIAMLSRTEGWSHSGTHFYRMGVEHGPHEWLYKSGQKCVTGTHENGKREGVWTEWHDNGQKESECTYRNGKRESVWTKWHDNGQKAFETGGVEGGFTAWRADGKKSLQEAPVNGKAERVWTQWHDNGQMKRQSTFKNDKKDGVWTEWDDKGNVTKTETYKSGKLVK